MKELNEVIRLLETKLPLPENEERLTRELERDMAEYFRQLEMAFPDMDMLYYKLVKP